MAHSFKFNLLTGLGLLLVPGATAYGGNGSDVDAQGGMSASYSQSALLRMAQSGDVTSLDSAYKLCTAVLNTWLAGKECHVSGQNQSIDVTVDVTAGKADEMCGYIVGFKSD